MIFDFYSLDKFAIKIFIIVGIITSNFYNSFHR